jgi:hypothetical protein
VGREPEGETFGDAVNLVDLADDQGSIGSHADKGLITAVRGTSPPPLPGPSPAARPRFR